MESLFLKGDPIESVTDLVKRVADRSGTLYLRGQVDWNWGLLPTIARLGQFQYAGRSVPIPADPQTQERAFLHRFRRHTYEEQGRILSEWEALFLARHHGLPVRLLDWTTNPLVALYFACIFEADPKTDGIIWSFERTFNNAEVDVFVSVSPFEVGGVRIVQPFYPTRKMTAQSGLFTIHGYPWHDLSELNPKTSTTDILTGERWNVPSSRKQKILRELMRLGINARTLFPDLYGLAQGIIEVEVFRGPEYETAAYSTMMNRPYKTTD